MTILNRVDYVAEALSKLPSQFSKSENLKGLIQSFMEEVQTVEDLFHQLNDERGLPTAIGAQLDVIGENHLVYRGGRNDEDYRQAIINRIAVTNSTATIDNLIEIAQLISQSNESTLVEAYPAGVYFQIINLISNITPETLDSACAAGVSSLVIYHADDNNYWLPGVAISSSEGMILQDGDTFQVFDEEGFNTFTVEESDPIGSPTRSYLPYGQNAPVVNVPSVAFTGGYTIT